MPHLKNKNLVGIPWRVAFALQADGWYLRQENIWHKTNGMPESVEDRTTRAHESVFHLAKSERYFFDLDAIAEQAVSTSNRGGNKKAQHLVAGKGEYGDGFKERWQPKATRQARSVWPIATRALSEAHYAPMPEQIAERCIRAGSRPGDTVLDPWAGTGTTLRVAERLQRVGIGIDLNQDYIDIAARRTDGVQVEIV